MNFSVFSDKCIGYKNIKQGKKSQDYGDYKIYKNKLIAVVADGHSDRYFKYSDIGAKFACKAFIEVMSEYIKDKSNNIYTDINNNIVQENIYTKWRSLVYEHFYKINPRVYKIDYHRYATTISGVYINEDKIITLKLGDSEIIINRNKLFEVSKNKNNGKFVQSLAGDNSYENMVCETNDLEGIKYITLFTDGYENSFNSKDLMYKDLDDTISKYENSVFTKVKLYKTYNEYLTNLSLNGSKDDIHIIFILVKK